VVENIIVQSGCRGTKRTRIEKSEDAAKRPHNNNASIHLFFDTIVMKRNKTPSLNKAPSLYYKIVRLMVLPTLDFRVALLLRPLPALMLESL
jgi:hypothetical protein